jgi:RHS repeat-associated protein
MRFFLLFSMAPGNLHVSTLVHYVYDLVCIIQQANDPTGTYAFSYDNLGRLIGTTTSYSSLSSRNFTNSYTYDAASNRTGFTDPEGGATSYAYDTLNRLSSLAPPTTFGNGSFGFSYDALSRRTQMTRPNGVTSNYTYDNLSRLLSVLHQLGGSTIDGAAYAVDAVGNRTSKTDQLATVTTNYGYDAIYQLVQATQGANATESYTYDPAGNRLSSLGVSPYSYNSSNELASTPNALFTFDDNGNTVSKTESSGTTQYTWDYENRLTQVTLPGNGGSVTFKYDPDGRRIYKSSSSGTSIFAYDGDNLIEETNSSGVVVARYAQGSTIDEPLAMLRSSTISYYQADGLRSITSLGNTAGALTQTYTFDSFGKQTASSGSLTNPFQFTSRELDTETGLYSYRARYFDPSTGRFLSEDPLGFSIGFNFYTYVLNNPTNDIDPAGLSPYDLYEKARRGLKKGNCLLSAATCRLREQVDALNSMSNDAITNTTIAQQQKGPATGQEDAQRLQLCLSSDQNCKDALERCIQFALTNPFPPPSWLSDIIDYFSKNPPTPAPPIKRE